MKIKNLLLFSILSLSLVSCSNTNEENIETLKNIVFQISEGKFKEAQNNLDHLDFLMVSSRTSLTSTLTPPTAFLPLDPCKAPLPRS